MKCIIIDDELTARSITEKLVSKHEILNLEGSFSNALEAIKFLNQHEGIDLVFLDIHMPDFSGFDFIRTLKKPPLIILVSSDKDFALDAFEYDCVTDYLVKPIEIDRFDKAIEKAKREVTNKSQNLTYKDASKPLKLSDFYINIDRRLIKIDIPTINLIEAKGDYIHIKTETKNYTVHSTLKKIEEKLPPELFLKVHRSYIINTKKIIDIEDNSVLIGKDVIPVSRSNRPELMKRLNLL